MTGFRLITPISFKENQYVSLGAVVFIALFLVLFIVNSATAQWGVGKTVDELLEDLDDLNFRAVNLEREAEDKKQEADSDKQYHDSKIDAWYVNEIELRSSNNLGERLEEEGEYHSNQQFEIIAERDILEQQCRENGFVVNYQGDEMVCVMECDRDDDDCNHRRVIMNNLIRDFDRRKGVYLGTFQEFLGRFGPWREENQRLKDNQGTMELQIDIARSNYDFISGELNVFRESLAGINEERQAIIRELGVKNVLVPVEDFSTSISDCSRMGKTEEILHCLQGYYDGNLRPLPLLPVPEFD